MISDSLSLCPSEWRILKALAEQGHSNPEGVSGSKLNSSHGIGPGTWGEYKKRLESDYLIEFVGISKEGHEKKLYRITDLGFLTLLKNYDAKKLHYEYSPKWLKENLPLIDLDLWNKLENEIGKTLPYFVLAIAINSIIVRPLFPDAKTKLDKSVFEIKYEMPFYVARLITNATFSTLTRKEISKLAQGKNFNHRAIDEFQEQSNLMEDLAVHFYLYLVQQLSTPIMLFAYWKESENLNVKGNSRYIEKFEKKGDDLKGEMAKAILKNPRLEKIFQDQYEMYSRFLSQGETWLKFELGYVGKMKN